VPVHESPLTRLERHARSRALEVAVAEQRGGSWASLTWNELYRRVIDGAAGMIEAGVNPGQVVVIRVPTGIRQVELELATRVAGAVPLLLPDHLDPQEVERLRGMGLDRRKRQPDLLRWVDAARADVPSSAVLGLPREKSQAWLFRPESSGTLTDLVADDVVLLTGEATDRFTTVVRDAHLTAGCLLVWVEHPEELEAALAAYSPTHVLLDHLTARLLEDLMVAGRIDGEPWHETPQEVLEATSARVAEARLSSRTKKLAADISALAPWWGERLRVLVLDARVNRTVSGLATTLGFRIGRIAHHPAVKLDLAREHVVMAVPAAPAVEVPDAALPRRGGRTGLDSAFTLSGS